MQTSTPKVDLIFWDKQSVQNAYPQPLYCFADLTKAGYTHEYLSPANFLLERAIVRDGVFAPTAQAAKAIIIRGNDTLTPEGVQYLATYSAAGLPIVISGGLPSKYGSGNQAAVSKAKATLQGLLSLKHVHQVPLEGLAARIKSMGITSRVQVQSNGSGTQDGERIHQEISMSGFTMTAQTLQEASLLRPVEFHIFSMHGQAKKS